MSSIDPDDGLLQCNEAVSLEAVDISTVRASGDLAIQATEERSLPDLPVNDPSPSSTKLHSLYTAYVMGSQLKSLSVDAMTGHNSGQSKDACTLSIRYTGLSYTVAIHGPLEHCEQEK